MNGFAIDSGANIELKYSCRSLPKSSENSALSSQRKQNQHQHQRPFTAKDAEDAKESKPTVMNADERGMQGEESRQEVEFVPVPGGYGFERVRLRIEPGMPG